MKIIQNLPKMKIKDMMQLWKNAVTILSDKKKKKMWPNARKVLDAISEEWSRRIREPIDPDNFFIWPSTEANLGDGTISTREWLPEGVLHYMGYKVGRTE